MLITPEQFKKCFSTSKDPEEWVKELNELLPKHDITSLLRVSAFLAQCGHESGGFTVLKENLNYSTTQLLAVWPSRFTQKIVGQYARKPEKIANKVYADRMGNGTEESGDGWKYRGRGLIQLTGKINYFSFAKAIGMPYDEITPYMETKAGAVESACWYWSNNRINSIVDTGGMRKLTKIINGGVHGLADRENRYTQIKTILEAC